MSSLQMRNRSYSIKTLLHLNSSDSKIPQFKHFFSFYNTKCPRMLNHRRDKLTGKCLKCGHQQSEEWKYSEAGFEFYKMYFKDYDKILIRRKIQEILNKIVEDTFDMLSKDLIQVIKKVENKNQLTEAVTLLLNKSLIEPNYMVLYASVCNKLANLSICDEGTEYTFQAELLNIFHEITDTFPRGDRERRQYLRAAKFSGHTSQKNIFFRPFTDNLINTLLESDDVDFAVEGLCKLLPLVSTKTPVFLDQLKRFSKLKPNVPRIKFLMMDALDSIAKEPRNGDIVKIKNRWGTPRREFTDKKFGSRFNNKIDSY